MPGKVEAFYDKFADRLLRDYVRGNARVIRQLQFFAHAIPSLARRVLMVGSGTGYGAHYVATRIARKAQVLAVDISGRNIMFAKNLFAHSRIEYRRLDLASAAPEGQWDVILLPDVYEHIAIVDRYHFHESMRKCLAPDGLILVTVPTPAHQEYLRRSGSLLQPVDENVSIDVLQKLAKDTKTRIGYYSEITVWMTNDYAHAALYRGDAKVRSPLKSDAARLRRVSGSLFRRGLRFMGRAMGWYKFREALLRRRLVECIRADECNEKKANG